MEVKKKKKEKEKHIDQKEIKPLRYDLEEENLVSRKGISFLSFDSFLRIFDRFVELADNG